MTNEFKPGDIVRYAGPRQVQVVGLPQIWRDRWSRRVPYVVVRVINDDSDHQETEFHCFELCFGEGRSQVNHALGGYPDEFIVTADRLEIVHTSTWDRSE